MTFFSFFDELEDYIRARLSRRPVLYGFIAGVGAVLFFRGVWMFADDFGISALMSLLLSMAILLLSGAFVSHFVSDKLIASGLRKEKKLIDKTEAEVREEMTSIKELRAEIRALREEITGKK